jgi:MFS family permease
MSGPDRRARVSGATGPGVASTFLRWTFLRSVFHRGYVLVSGLYFVITAHLSAWQLLVLGTVLSVTLLASDIPTGVWSDAVSRKWPLVAGHAFLAAGMVMTGLVTGFPLLVATQVLWGIGWGFSSGADVAWITDELGQPARIAKVLTARARWDSVGSAAGMAAFGLLGWAAGLAAATVASGVGVALVGVFVAIRFTEDNFTPVDGPRWGASLAILRRGAALARGDRQILRMFAATTLINAASMVTWLFAKQLIDRGFPGDPVLWYTALGILSFVLGAAALRLVEARIDGVGVARRAYVFSCLTGVVGLIVLACAPDGLVGSVGVLLAQGIAFTVTRAVSVIWVNQRVSSDVRATVHSFLSQAECAGEIASGFPLAALAGVAGIPTALFTSAVITASAGAAIARSGAGFRSRVGSRSGAGSGSGSRWGARRVRRPRRPPADKPHS